LHTFKAFNVRFNCNVSNSTKVYVKDIILRWSTIDNLMRQTVDNNKHAFHVYVQPISVIIWEDLERTNVNSVNAIIIHLPAISRAGLLAFFYQSYTFVTQLKIATFMVLLSGGFSNFKINNAKWSQAIYRVLKKHFQMADRNTGKTHIRLPFSIFSNRFFWFDFHS